ncbi:MAG: hypothetical protein ACREFX_04400, partial [Opitutaceae bacterium]
CVVLSCGSHPPTAVLAAVFAFGVGAVVLLAAIVGRVRWGAARGALSGAALAGLLGLAALAPWLRLLSGVGRHLDSYPMGSGSIQYYAERCDSWLGRFCPIPYDALSWKRGTDGVQTPYLEAPLCIGLLLIIGWQGWVWLRGRRGGRPPAPAGAGLWDAAAGPLFFGSALWFAALTLLSLPLSWSSRLNPLGPYLQFAYRMVAHANAALLLAVFAAGGWLAARGAFEARRRGQRLVAAMALVLSACALLVKLPHGRAIESFDESAKYLPGGPVGEIVSQGDGWLDPLYAATGRFRKLAPAELARARALRFPVGAGPADFGDVGTVDFDQPTAGWAVTNLVAFPWSRVVVDGRRWGALGVGPDRRLALWLPAGRSVVRWWWRPDPVWAALYRLSRPALAILLSLSFVWAALAAGRLHRRALASAPRALTLPPLSPP